MLRHSSCRNARTRFVYASGRRVTVIAKLCLSGQSKVFTGEIVKMGEGDGMASDDDVGDDVPNSAKKDRTYDREKRSRNFQTSWCDKWPWLRYDEVRNVLTCDFCSRFPSVSSRHGVKNTFIDIKRHFKTGIFQVTSLLDR